MLRVFVAMGCLALIASLSACAPPGQAKAPQFASLDRPLSDNFVQLALIERNSSQEHLIQELLDYLMG